MDLTILLTVHNEYEFAKLAIQGIRSLGDEVEGTDLILIDNASTDGIGEWAKMQEDISYVYMEEGLTPWGDVISQVIEAFAIKKDILLLQSRFILLPGALTHLYQTLYSDKTIGAVGSITSNAALIAQQPAEQIHDLSDVVKYEKKHSADIPKRVMELDCGLIMLKAYALREDSLFLPELFSLYGIAKNISLELICRDYQLMVCRNVAVFEMKSGYSEAPELQKKWGQDIKTLERKWGMHYFMLSGRNILTEMIDAPEGEKIRVMEVGCDCGATLLEVKNLFPESYVIGCEISRASAKIAEHVLDEVYIANIENEDLPVLHDSLDYVVFGDVLEHLHNPQKTLEYIRRLLKPGGKVIACIPNLMHISVMRQLLQGNFTYEDYGLLDKTHIHLFTGNEILRMFRQAGYEVEEFRHIDDERKDGDDEIIDGLLKMGNEVERYMYTAYWYTIRGTKCQP